jgi:hypothetical protein
MDLFIGKLIANNHYQSDAIKRHELLEKRERERQSRGKSGYLTRGYLHIIPGNYL